MWGRRHPPYIRWVTCYCGERVVAKVVQSARGRRVNVIVCPRCDKAKGEKRDPRT
jgi:hypothetical protein